MVTDVTTLLNTLSANQTTEYTLEGWDELTGEWYVIDSSCFIANLNTEAIEGKWRLVATLVVMNSDDSRTNF